MTSWVETTCPPGWAVRWAVGVDVPQKVCAYQLHPVAGVAQTWSGDPQWCDTVEDARRQAWERWALGVLGDRFHWGRGHYVRPRQMLWSPQCDLRLELTTNGEGYVISDGIEWSLRSDDPVEALARLAAMSLAVLGPIGQTTDAQSKGKGDA